MSHGVYRWSLFVFLRCALVTAALAFFLELPPPLIEPDTYLHLATGQLIAERSIPRQDPFSYTVKGQPWLAHEWLSARLMYAAHAFGGPRFLVWCTAVTASASLALIGAAARQGGVRSPLAVGLAQLFAAGLTAHVFCVRPHMLTSLALALQVFLVAGFARTRRISFLVALPPLFVVWANCHGGFIIGALPFAAALVDLATAPRAPGSTYKRDLGWLAGTGLASAASCCINPSGASLLAFPLRFGSAAFSHIPEWQAPTLADAPWPLILMLGSLAIFWRWRSELRAGDFLTLVAVYLLGFSARRHSQVVAVLAAPILARCIERALRGPGWIAAAPGEAPPSRPGGSFVAAAVALLITLAGSAFQDFVGPAQLPQQAVFELKKRQPDGHVFHSAALGSYLIWALGPSWPVFIDGRLELYAETPVVRAYFKLMRTEAGWEQALEAYQIRWVLVEAREPLAQALSTSPGWEIVRLDPPYVLLHRTR